MTIIEQPSGIVSAYHDQYLEVIDTAATDSGYVTVYIEYHNGDQNWKALPHQSQKKYRNSNRFKFNLSAMLQETVLGTDNVSAAASATLINYNNSAAHVRAKLEHFELSAGVYVSQSTAATSAFIVVNAIVDTVSDYVIEQSSGNEFLTTLKEQEIRSGEHVQFAFLWDDTQVSLRTAVKTYPISGSPTTAYKAITAFDYEYAGFYGIDGDTLTSSPALTTSNAVLDYITSEGGEEYIGVNLDSAGHITFNNSDIGKKVRFEIFALATGSGVKITYNGAASNETLTVSATGYSILTGTAIPSSTTSIKIENLTGDTLYLTYVNILDESYETVINNRAISYLNEYDATASKVEVWVDNDGSACSEIVTLNMRHVSAGLRLAWKALTGNIEHYTFTDFTTLSNSVEKKKIISEDSVRGIKTTNTQSTDVYTVYSFFENADVMRWLSEVAQSPEVWLVNAYNDKVPVDVTNSSFPIDSPSLVQGSVSFQLSNVRTVHNG